MLAIGGHGGELIAGVPLPISVSRAPHLFAHIDFVVRRGQRGDEARDAFMEYVQIASAFFVFGAFARCRLFTVRVRCFAQNSVCDEVDTRAIRSGLVDADDTLYPGAFSG